MKEDNEHLEQPHESPTTSPHKNNNNNTTTATATATKTVLVTVGTTKFDELIRAVDNRAFSDALTSLGYTRLVLQIGAGEYRPLRLFPANARAAKINNGLEIEWFEFTPSLASYIENAALVISHAGAGSIFESLRLGKSLIAVPNPLLMDDHQRELAEKLEKDGFLVAAVPEAKDIVRAVEEVGDGRRFKKYPMGGPEGIADAVDDLRRRWF